MPQAKQKETDLQNSDTRVRELKRNMTRLSFIGMGLSQPLDEALKQLRLSIKQNAEDARINQDVDEISKILRTLEEPKPEKKSRSRIETPPDFGEAIINKNFPSDLQKQLKRVHRSRNSEDANVLISEMTRVIQSYIQRVEAKIEEQNSPAQSNELATVEIPKPGFFSRLFTKSSSKTSDEPEVAEQKSSANEFQIDLEIPKSVIDSLQHLIDQLSSMNGYAQIASLLNKEINRVEKIDQLSSILEIITGAFIEISNQEHVQFENFLKSLNKRIVRVNEFIHTTLSYAETSSKDSEQLNLNLSGNLVDIKNNLSSANSLEEVKDNLFSKLDTISTHLNHYCEKQATNSQALTSQIDRLSEQLRATEDESTRLKDELAEQRARAQTDPLTTLPNRYSYNERLTQEYNRWRRYCHPLTIAIADIDLFKSINDTHGHQTGDAVLQEVAKQLQNGIRESDFVARFGGEEFVILMPETALIDATRAMNQLRQSIASSPFNDGNIQIDITLSFGLSEFNGDDTAKDVFERADSALYRAKDKGRNLVCCQRAK